MKSLLVISDQKPITNVTTAGHVEVLVRLNFGGGPFRIYMIPPHLTNNSGEYEIKKMNLTMH